MKDKICLKLMDSRCEKDYKNKHYWERRGVLYMESYPYVVWQCTQCDLFIREQIIFLSEKVRRNG